MGLITLYRLVYCYRRINLAENATAQVSAVIAVHGTVTPGHITIGRHVIAHHPLCREHKTSNEFTVFTHDERCVKTPTFTLNQFSANKISPDVRSHAVVMQELDTRHHRLGAHISTSRLIDDITLNVSPVIVKDQHVKIMIDRLSQQCRHHPINQEIVTVNKVHIAATGMV